MALAGVLLARPHTSLDLRRTLASLATVAVAAAALGSLVPAAVEAATVSAAPGPVRVSLLGSVSTEGLPVTPAVSRLVVRNDSPVAVRWSATSVVLGAGAPAVRVAIWVLTGSSCTGPRDALASREWSTEELAPGSALAICVRVSGTGAGAGRAQPRVTVQARAA